MIVTSVMGGVILCVLLLAGLFVFYSRLKWNRTAVRRYIQSILLSSIAFRLRAVSESKPADAEAMAILAANGGERSDSP